MDRPRGKTGVCFMALGLLQDATAVEIRQWAFWRGERLTAEEVRGGLQALSKRQLPLAEMTERSETGKGMAGRWRLTKRGRVIYAATGEPSVSPPLD